MKGKHLENKIFSTIIVIQIVELILVVTLLVFSFMLAGMFIYDDFFPYGYFNGIVFSFMAASIAVLILSSYKYFNFLDTSYTGVMGKVTWVVFIINFILIIMLYFGSDMRLSLYYFVIALTLQVGFLLLIKIFSSVLKHKILSSKSSLILGKEEDKNIILNSIRRNFEGGLTFVDVNDKNISKYIDMADNTYLMSTSPLEIKTEVVTYCEINNKRLYLVPEMHEIAMRNSEMTQINDIPLFTIEGFRLTESQSIIKRLIDIPLSLLGIFLSLPIIATFALLIKAEDGGPVFFKQIRSGINGKEFQIFKLRSMIVDAEKETGSILAKDNDPRITKIGRLMRAVRIDEFPQFYNVLLGSMSIVGPRPERPIFVEEFCKKSPEYMQRMAVKPGITGLAQVLANYTTTAENKLKFDLIYIKKYSPLLDLNILLKTFKVLFSSEKAKGFSETIESSDFIIEEGIVLEDESYQKGKRNRRITYNYLRASLIILSCFIIVSGSFVMRYSSMIVTLIEATMFPIEVSNEFYIGEGIPIRDLEVGATMGIVDLPQEKESNKTIIESEIPMASLPSQGDLGNNLHLKIIKKMTIQQKIRISYELSKKINLSDMAALEKFSEDGFSEKESLHVKEILARSFTEKDKSDLQKLLANL